MSMRVPRFFCKPIYAASLSLLIGIFNTTASANSESQAMKAIPEIGHAEVKSSHREESSALLAARLVGDLDTDNDGHPDFADNCRDVANPTQCDGDNDGYGNHCDADLNNDLVTNGLDVGPLKAAFGTTDTTADLNCDGIVNGLDVGPFKAMFGSTPGPSDMSCAGTTPCPGPAVFDWPMPGVDAGDWVINNYVDLATGPAILDYQGGSKSYNGHQGIDVDVPSFREMDGDFPIIAVAQGTVLALEDGNFDRNTSCAGSWNYVTIGHPNGWKTIYGHLKMNSVVVTVGQVVESGDMLGVVGSSGCSTAPHLHLETVDEAGDIISPFLEGLWSTPPVYDTPFGFMDAMLYSSAINNVNMIKDPAPNATQVAIGGTLGTGLSMAGGGPGDAINLTIVDSSSGLVNSTDISFAQVYRHTYWWQNYTFAGSASGPHQLQISLNGDLVQTYDFDVAAILTGFQQVRHGVPAASYQTLFNNLTANGYRPVWVDGYDVNGSTFFNVIFDQSAVASWSAAHGQNNAQYQAYFNAQVLAGRRLAHIDSYLDNGEMRHASIFVDQPGTAWAAYHGVTTAAHQAQFNSLIAQGYRASIISSVQENGVQRISALYDKNAVGGWVAQANLSSAQYQTAFTNQTDAGRVLSYLNAYTLNGAPRFSAIWNSVVPGSWVARHDLNSTQFQNEFDNWVGNFNLNTRVVTGYENGGVANFGGLWTD